MLWRIRVTSEEGKPISILQAAKRVGGYVLASLPAEAGLLPILWDARKQGRHDKIARAMVVDISDQYKNFAEVPAAVDDRAPAQRLDFATARRGWPLATLGFIVCACATTFPLFLQLGTRIAGKPGDSSVFLWNY